MSLVDTVVNKFRIWKQQTNALNRRVKELEQRLTQLEAQLGSPVYKSVALPESPISPLNALDWRGVGIVTATSSGGDSDLIEVQLAEPSGQKNWVNSSEEATVYVVGAVGHSFALNDIVLFFWEGLTATGTAIYRAVQSGGTASIRTVTGNAAGDGVYTTSSGDVTHWQEYALGLTGHRLQVGNSLICWSAGGTTYGISGGAYGTS